MRDFSSEEMWAKKISITEDQITLKGLPLVYAFKEIRWGLVVLLAGWFCLQFE